ncbi:hypothetical protein BKA93DRAFT_833602 [Sparassis latifolia]
MVTLNFSQRAVKEENIMSGTRSFHRSAEPGEEGPTNLGRIVKRPTDMEMSELVGGMRSAVKANSSRPWDPGENLAMLQINNGIPDRAVTTSRRDNWTRNEISKRRNFYIDLHELVLLLRWLGSISSGPVRQEHSRQVRCIQFWRRPTTERDLEARQACARKQSCVTVDLETAYPPDESTEKYGFKSTLGKRPFLYRRASYLKCLTWGVNAEKKLETDLTKVLAMLELLHRQLLTDSQTREEEQLTDVGSRLKSGRPGNVSHNTP